MIAKLSTGILELLVVLQLLPTALPSDIPKPIKLGRFNIRKDAITLSGFSGGASMTTQLHVAHSRMFRGVGLFSQAFYRCGHCSLEDASRFCGANTTAPYNVSKSILDARRYEKAGLIDPLSYLENQRVFIWMGSMDEWVSPEMGMDNAKFYKAFMPRDISITGKLAEAKHVFPTNNFGKPCDQQGTDHYYLGNCSYKGAYNALEFILRDVVQITDLFQESDLQIQPLLTFSQSEFYPEGDITEVGMNEVGFFYVPQRCRNETYKCLLHVFFQGCSKSSPKIALPFILNSGFLPVAEENDIILLFPLTVEIPDNWGGCWDFFSYTGDLFATQKGAQIQVLKAILDHVVGNKVSKMVAGSYTVLVTVLGILTVIR